MSNSYKPYAECVVTSAPSVYGIVQEPVVVVTSVAEDIHEQDDSYINNGVYRDHVGEIWGEDAPSLQGISLDTGRNTGIVFQKIGTGFTVQDDWIDPLYSAYGLLIPDSTAGATAFEVKQMAADTGLQQYKMILRRGVPPLASSPTADTCYTAIEFCSGSVLNYRLMCAYGTPIRLQISRDTGATWTDVKQARRLPKSEDFFHMSNDTLPIVTFHDYNKGVFAIMVSEGITLMHKPEEGLGGVNGKVRVTGRNGWHTFTMFRNWHSNVKVTKKLKIQPATNTGLSFLVGNALTTDVQNANTTVTNDGSGTYTWTADISKTDDSGSGLGSSTPPRFTDGTLIQPAYWATSIPGGVNDTSIHSLKVLRVDELEEWDDNNRVGSQSATVYLNNYDGSYNGAVGKQACYINASIDNGVTIYRRMTGYSGGGSEGPGFENPNATTNVISLPVFDKSDAAGNGQPPVVLGYELQADGYCIFSIVRLAAEMGNIRSDFLAKLPDSSSRGNDATPVTPGAGSTGGGIYYPPGAPTVGPGFNGHAPYGPADQYCPYEILGRGVGDSPLYVFGKEMTPWQVLQRLVMEMSFRYVDPQTGYVTWIPYMMYFDKDGYFRFEPYHPALIDFTCGLAANPVAAAIEYPDVLWYPLTSFTLNSSVAQMRSEITFQSTDALSNELLQAHLDMPAYVKERIGHRSNWVEGSSRWGEQATLNKLILTAGGQSSLPSETGKGSMPFLPFLHAGNKVWLYHQSIGAAPQPFYITRLQSAYGMSSIDGSNGLQINTSSFVARAVVNFL